MAITQTAIEKSALEKSALDRLRLVAISHFFLGAITVCGFLCIVWSIASSGNLRLTPNADGSVNLNLDTIGSLLALFALALLALAVVTVVASPIISGICILGRKFRWLSIVVSILYLPFFPIGTIISVYSLMALTSPAAHMAYRAS